MARPIERWYLYSQDIARYCDATPQKIEKDAKAGKLIREDLLSLLVYVGGTLSPEYRKEMQVGLALNLKDATEREAWDGGTTSVRVDVSDSDDVLRWTISSEVVEDQLAISKHKWHSGVSREGVCPGNLLNLLRFCAFRARADFRAQICQAVYSAPAASLPPATDKVRRR